MRGSKGRRAPGGLGVSHRGACDGHATAPVATTGGRRWSRNAAAAPEGSGAQRAGRRRRRVARRGGRRRRTTGGRRGRRPRAVERHRRLEQRARHHPQQRYERGGRQEPVVWRRGSIRSARVRTSSVGATAAVRLHVARCVRSPSRALEPETVERAASDAHDQRRRSQPSYTHAPSPTCTTLLPASSAVAPPQLPWSASGPQWSAQRRCWCDGGV